MCSETVSSNVTLHQEILEAQKTTASLWKWKLILISALASVGFGVSIGSPPTKGVPLVLCCIPLVCIYTDLLNRHLCVRAKIVGKWRTTHGTEFGHCGYEKFLKHLEENVTGIWSFEDTAIYLSSYLACAGLVAIGIWNIYKASLGTEPLNSPFEFILVAGSGLLGFLATIRVRFTSEKLFNKINEQARNYEKHLEQEFKNKPAENEGQAQSPQRTSP